MFGRKPRIEPALPQQRIEPRAPRFGASPDMLAMSKRKQAPASLFQMPQHPPGVAPSSSGMAMDSDLVGPTTWAAQSYAGVYGGLGYGANCTQGFIGYAVLAELSQRPEYRRISEVIARHMTRRWIKLKVKGEDDKTDKLAQLQDAMDKLRVQDVFRRAVESDGFFGRAHVFLDFGNDDPAELSKPIGNGEDDLGAAKIKKGSLRALRNVEAIWTYPQDYNSTSPISPDWYKPRSWRVMGQNIHGSRLLTIIGREVSDILKPSYAFGGLSMSQLAMSYIDNWLEVRDSVTSIISAFSVFVLSTNMTDALNAETASESASASFYARLDAFVNTRDNRGVMAIDKESEDFHNVSAPLGGLDTLQAQAQEHIASICGIPLVELLGIQPAGLNASSEGEMETFRNNIHAAQENTLRSPITTVLNFVQLSEFGAVDPDIDFDFEPLEMMDDKELAEIKLIEAQTDEVLAGFGVISAAESRKRVAADPDSPYAGLDPDDLPEPPMGETEPEPPPPPPRVAGEDSE